MSDYLDPNNDELLKDFFVEAESQIELLEQNILVLESDAGNSDAIDEIFRATHTLKGASATVQMDELTSFTHILEDLLDEIRSGTVKVTSDLVDNLLAAIDVIKEMIESRRQGDVFREDIGSLTAALKSYAYGEAVTTSSKGAVNGAPASAPAASATASTPVAGMDETAANEILENLESGQQAYRITVSFDEDNPMNTVGGIQVFAALKGFGQVLKTEPEFEQLYEDVFFPQVVYYLASGSTPDEIASAVRLPDVTLGSEVELVSAAQSADSNVQTPVAAEPSPAHRDQTAGAATSASPSASAAAVETDQSGEISVEQQLQQSQAESEEADPAARNTDRKSSSVTGSILRVDSRRIDNLLNLVSETVINKASFNQISSEFGETLGNLQSTTSQYRELVKELFDAMPGYLERLQNGETIKDVKREIQERFGGLYSMFDTYESQYKTTVGKFRNTSQNLGRITSELQEGVMRIRMVPISQIFSRFPRLVRDLSRSLNKKIELEIEGEDTELDKSVIEDLLDPLIHCVRNSIDHGIESPQDRVSAGKTEQGHVKLRASNEGNMILIEISDDGSGIDVESIRKKAIDRGVIHPSKVLSDVEAFNLIFDPGFSTAREITNISGRGVGLDVVKRQIEKLNGNVTVQSSRGQGSRFIIKIPLTLAIIQGLLVRVGSEMYAIPITSVIDSHRIKPSDIKMIDNYEVFNVREDVVSLLRLNRLFKIDSSEEKEYHFVVIVGSGDKRMGLVVDQLIGEEDVVIKPLRDHYTNVPGIAGANITGDGTVSLIIDVSQLLDLGLQQEKELRNIRQTTTEG
ncbi:chemotaxis protein CheA [Spirochaeta africana]|uniref:Chemotaxis protein CheA n=1 Tax=Spirochaeta africana (strain ATCC 700263 / DSM 8902 / Z-7692) TaxID=889378 RepID=H9UJN5_SPIAZ|nr:chemotaxis protein CheA [Spirochaeta africana]AFG37728.1 chemotaxis protein histidine kinase-like protein [Spirochaeta africana DSM 8902]